jgi:hypothetical protein
MAKKQIVEEAWPHGRRRVLKEEDTMDAASQKIVQQIALGAKAAGLLDTENPLEDTMFVLRDIVRHPNALKMELKKMAKSGSRAAQTLRTVRKEI